MRCGVGSGGEEDGGYAGVQWRRGDRALEAEMGIHGAADVALTAARGALYGLCAYGTYDLTNQATLRHWPTYLTLADLAWGTALSGFAALVAALVRRRGG